MSKDLNIGTNVRLIALPTYLKTAEPMPTLLSPSVLPVGTSGLIVDRKPGNYWVVKFERGAFLLEEQYLAAIED
jgi:Protein of unknown function (DUF3148)